MKKEAKEDVGITFILFLSAVSFITFGVMFVASFFDWNPSIYTDSILLISLGIFMAKEGEIFSWTNYIKDKRISQEELLRIIVGLLGITAITLGIAGIMGQTGKGFQGMKGILSLIAMIMILFESFLMSKVKNPKKKIAKNL